MGNLKDLVQKAKNKFLETLPTPSNFSRDVQRVNREVVQPLIQRRNIVQQQFNQSNPTIANINRITQKYNPPMAINRFAINQARNYIKSLPEQGRKFNEVQRKISAGNWGDKGVQNEMINAGFMSGGVNQIGTRTARVIKRAVEKGASKKTINNILKIGEEKLAPITKEVVNIAKKGVVPDYMRKGYVDPVVGKPTSKINKIFAPGSYTLKKQSNYGKELANRLAKYENKIAELKGGYSADLSSVHSPNFFTEMTNTIKSVLGKGDETNARRFLRGEIKNVTPSERKMAETFKGILDNIYGKAKSTGVPELKGKMKDFFPKVYDWKKLNNPNFKNRAIKYLVDTKQAKTFDDAAGMLNSMQENILTRKAGSLEHSRTLNLPEEFEINPLDAIKSYVEDSSRRISEVEQFGPDGEIAKQLLDSISSSGGDRAFAEEVYKLVTGLKRYDNPYVDAAIKTTYITKLYNSFVVNASQPINTGVQAGIFRMIGDVIRAYGAPYKSGLKAMRTGAIEDAVTGGAAEGAAMDRVSNIVLGSFKAGEKKNRVSAALSGMSWAEVNAKKLLKPGVSKGWFSQYQRAVRQFEAMGMDADKIAKQGKILPEDILQGGHGLSSSSQFKTGPLELPPWAKTNIGRMLWALKSFTYKQTGFIYKQVVVEAAHGNIEPLIRLLILSAPAIYTYQTGRNLIQGVTDNDKRIKLNDPKSWGSAMYQGTLLDTVLSSAQYLKGQYAFNYTDEDQQFLNNIKKVSSTAQNVLGPVLGEPLAFGNTLLDAAITKSQNSKYGREKRPKDEYLSMKKYFVSKVPPIGKWISNKYLPWPESKSTKTDEEKAQIKIMYEGLSAVEKTYTTKELMASKLLNASSEGTDQKISAQQKAILYINFPNVLKGQTAVQRQLEFHDPFFDLDMNQQNAYNLAHAPLPGESTDLKKAVLYSQPWYASFQKKREKYYNELTLKTGEKPEDNGYPKITPALQAKQDAFFKLSSGKAKQAYLQKNPDLLAYWDKKDAYTNGERFELGMPAMPEESGSSFKPWPKTLPKIKISMPKVTPNKQSVRKPKLVVIKPRKITKASLSRGR